jgi:hypothetical protein
MQPKTDVTPAQALNALVRPEEKAINELLTKTMRSVVHSMLDVFLKEKFEIKLVKMCGDVYRKLIKTKEFTDHVDAASKNDDEAVKTLKAKATPTAKPKPKARSTKLPCKTKKKVNESKGDDTDTDGEDLDDTVAEDKAELEGQVNDDDYKADPEATQDDLDFIDDGEGEDDEIVNETVPVGAPLQQETDELDPLELDVLQPEDQAQAQAETEAETVNEFDDLEPDDEKKKTEQEQDDLFANLPKEI